MDNLPWFAPTLVAWLVVAGLVARRTGRAFSMHSSLSAGLTMSVGIVLSATLTPFRGAVAGRFARPAVCDLTRLAPASIDQILRFDDVGLNVLLFVPLGLTLGLITHARLRLALLLAAIALPSIVEVSQLLLPALGRACESGDVIDNLTGLALGLGVGSALRLAGRR
ncbi:MAG: VanZ family protein [Candidatus Limnocylindrales bacterium]